MANQCNCGCGTTIKPGNRFVRGHNKANLGRIYSQSNERPFPPPNPSGLCQCGCGQITPIAKRARVEDGIEKGHHQRYVAGHMGENAGQFSKGHIPANKGNGEWLNTHLGRWMKVREDGTRDYRYRIVAEQMLGRPLRSSEHVHHLNGDPTDDRPENLEVLGASEHFKRHPDRPPPPSNYQPNTFYLGRMKSWIAIHGRIPKQREIDADPSMPDSTTYRKRFGSFPNAINQALGHVATHERQ